MSRQPMNQAVISQVLYFLRNGQWRRSLDLGFTEEDLTVIKDPEVISMLLNTPVCWASAKIHSDVLKRLLRCVRDSDKEIRIIDQMLKLGASSKMINSLFGLNPREVAIRKDSLHIEKKQGRWQELPEDEELKLWNKWKHKVELYQLNTDDLMDMAKLCMILSKDNEVPMAMIWQSMERWISAGKNDKGHQ